MTSSHVQQERNEHLKTEAEEPKVIAQGKGKSQLRGTKSTRKRAAIIRKYAAYYQQIVAVDPNFWDR